MFTVRNVLFALLFANLAYFAWAHWVDAPRPVVENAALAKLPRLKMRNEVVQPVPAPAPASAHKTALQATGAGSCVSIGPFGDIGSSARAAAVLKDKGFDPQQRAVAGETSDGFWVYVGGLKSDKDVERVRQDLVFHGITDARAMTDSGATGRRVSVGLFSERERAEKRAKQVQKLGLKAEVAERKLPVSVYWVDVTPPSERSSVPIDDLLAEGIGSKVGVEACPRPAVPAVTAPPAATASVSASPQTGTAASPKLP
ncbi:MAG TPA: SPOR domain-containing protein [Steroidobacteraceae bacterium]|nr:SPOR domain-containing protein [Steroidobacteraceae bacterium]